MYFQHCTWQHASAVNDIDVWNMSLIQLSIFSKENFDKIFYPVYKTAGNIFELLDWRISLSCEVPSLVWNICKHLYISSELKYFYPSLSHLYFPAAFWASTFMSFLSNMYFGACFQSKCSSLISGRTLKRSDKTE